MPEPRNSIIASDAFLYTHLYTPLSAQLCWVNPNIVTLLCFLCVFPLVYGLHAGWPLWMLVSLMFVRQSLDCLDGAIARQCGTASKTGALLDIVEDTLTVAVLGGYMIWALRSRLAIMIPFAAGILYALIVYVRQIRDHLANREIEYSAFEEFVHDNTVVLSIVLIVFFRVILS